MKRKSVITLIVVIAAVTAIFSVYMIASTLITSAQEQNAFGALSAIIEQEKEKQQDTEEEIPNNQTTVVLPAIVRPENETGTEPMILPEYEAIYEQNSDFFGWIRIDDTTVNYPVMHTPEDPQYYLRRAFDKSDAQSGTPFLDAEPENPYGWNSSTVVHILESREYTGCVVNFKSYTNSIWDEKQRDNPVENQAIFLDSHERIIEDEVFEKVQQIRQQRHRKTKSGRSSMFSGLVYCSDCGEKLYYGATNNYRTEGAFFDCSLHWKHKDKCGTHYIREKVLQQLVLQHIQMVTGYIYRHEAHFRQVMEQQLHAESAKQITANRKALERSEKRISELKRLFIKIYEDNASGKLSDERFDMMSQTYEAEQKELEAEVIRLQKEIEVQETQIQNIEKFIQKTGQYVGIEELTPYVLHELVKAIYVDAPDKSSGKRRQHIHIQYDGLGFIPLNELLTSEKA